MAVDLRPANDLVFGLTGVAATVTPRDCDTVETTVTWLAPSTARLMAGEPIEDQRWRVAVRRDHVASLPVGSTIEAPRAPEFPDARTWIVDAVEDLDPDVFYVRVH